MAKNIFTAEMEDYLLRSIRNGEDGNIYRCLVLKSDNQKIKVRDAWTWVQNNFNLRFGTQLSKEILRKKFYYLRSKTRAKAVSDREQEVKKNCQNFCRIPPGEQPDWGRAWHRSSRRGRRCATSRGSSAHWCGGQPQGIILNMMFSPSSLFYSNI